MDSIIILILQMRKLRLNKVKKLSQSLVGIQGNTRIWMVLSPDFPKPHRLLFLSLLQFLLIVGVSQSLIFRSYVYLYSRSITISRVSILWCVVCKDSQQFLPLTYCSSFEEVRSVSLLSWIWAGLVTCFDPENDWNWNVTVLGLALKKPSDFCFCFLRSQQPCVKVT